MGYVSLEVAGHVFHMTFPYRIPTAEACVLVASPLLFAAAGYLPAGQAAHLQLATALSWE